MTTLSKLYLENLVAGKLYKVDSANDAIKSVDGMKKYHDWISTEISGFGFLEGEIKPFIRTKTWMFLGEIKYFNFPKDDPHNISFKALKVLLDGTMVWLVIYSGCEFKKISIK